MVRIITIVTGVVMLDSNSTYGEACRMVGECCLMFAQNGEEVSLGRIVFWLERAQEEGMDKNGEPNDGMQLAIERLKGC